MRIAIVGGGVAGITAAYLIQRNHQVSLYEKNAYVGGHTHTITIPNGPDSGEDGIDDDGLMGALPLPMEM